MANILYRGSTPSAANASSGGQNRPLTNDEIDKNFYALNASKLETESDTLSTVTGRGASTSTNLTMSGNNTLGGSSASITTVKGTFNLDNVDATDSAGGSWSSTSPDVTISSFTYPRLDAVGTFTKRTGYWYSPTENTFGGIRLGSSTSSYVYSADFYQWRSEIYGYNTNAAADYAALKITQGSTSGLGLAIVANEQNHITLKAAVSSNNRGPRISLSHTSTDRGDVLSFLINPYYQTGAAVDQYIEMGYCGPWGIGGNNVQAGTGNAASLASRRYTRGFMLEDATFFKSSNGNHVILSGGYQDYSGGSWLQKYSVSSYALKQEFDWTARSVTWYSTTDGAGPRSAGTTIGGWAAMASLSTDAFTDVITLTVNGKIYASNTITSANDIIAYYSSDERLKTNIVRIDNALSKVNTLDGVTFNWNEKAQDRDVNKREAGVIAQQVQKILPEVVQKREDGTLAVKYEQLVPLLIEAVKELSTKVEDLQNQLANK